ncbi:MAG: alkaline phosphatase [Chthoniobacterales bacterium]|nr:alkaline phosphatase [Chthoniobacterales bacterium]
MITKFRNQLIALFCFLLFVGIGSIFFLRNSVQKPFAIILFIGDGMSPSLLTATRLYEGGADHRLALEEFPQVALTRTYANDFAVPDTASAATAIATGERVNHQSLAMSPAGKPLTTLLEEAMAKNRAIGLISNGSLTGETVAAFYAKSLNAQDNNENAKQLAKHFPIDVMLGGGRKYFTNQDSIVLKKPDQQTISENLNFLQQLSDKGIVIVNSMKELGMIPSWKSSPVLGLLTEEAFPFQNERISKDDSPSLAQLVEQGIQRLQHSRHGYFLVVDDALIGLAASLNNGEQLFHEISEFDQAIALARQYAGPNSLIIVTGKQNLGGLRMNGYPFRNDKGVAVLGLNQEGAPSITWSTGPGHNINGSISGTENAKETTSIFAEPSSFLSPSALGIAEDTLSMAIGPGSEQIHGVIDLTSIYDVVKKKL